MADLKKQAQTVVDDIGKLADDIGKEFGRRMDDSYDKSRKLAVKGMLKVLKLQRNTLDKTFDLVAKVQKRSEDMVEKRLSNASWMPEEGRGVLDEWTATLRQGREDFQKAIDKSNDLMTSFLKRVEKGKTGPKKVTEKKTDAAKPAAKKIAAKKKTAAKKPAAKKKSAPKKKSAASADAGSSS